MKGGVLYDSSTRPVKTPFGVHWWVNPDALKAGWRRTDVWDKP